jgi:hypothetical protein
MRQAVVAPGASPQTTRRPTATVRPPWPQALGPPVDAGGAHWVEPVLVAEHLRIERTGAAALLTLNRPEKRNALSIQLRPDLGEALAELVQDDTVSAIGLTGAGPAFCAGMDVSEFGGDKAHRELLVESSARCFRAVAPTDCRADQRAGDRGRVRDRLLCDIRVAAPAARVGFPELGRFIPPSYAAAAWSLPAGVARPVPHGTAPGRRRGPRARRRQPPQRQPRGARRGRGRARRRDRRGQATHPSRTRRSQRRPAARRRGTDAPHSPLLGHT